jgi:hypothetical protein
MREVFKPEPQPDPGRVFYTITAGDVGASVIQTAAGPANLSGWFGRVRETDVGLRLYRVPSVNSGTDGQPGAWIWDGESIDERDARLAQEPAHSNRTRAAMTPLERAMIPPRGCGEHHAGECTAEPPYVTKGPS